MTIPRILSTIFILLGFSYSLQSQSFPADTLVIGRYDRVALPSQSGKPIYLYASPLRSPKTSGTKMRPKDWVNFDYSKQENRLRGMGPQKDDIIMENSFEYTVNASQQRYYTFYYKGTGELISQEQLEQIRFSTIEAVRRAISPYRLTLPDDVWGALGELYRWQYPSLYVVSYDAERKGYYKYRIVLMVYYDYNHPNAYDGH